MIEQTLSCGIVLARKTEQGWCTLMLRAFHHWDFPKGVRERGKVARYYIASTETEVVEMGLSPETGEPEHHEWRWVTFDEAYDLGSPRVRQIVQWSRQIIGA